MKNLTAFLMLLSLGLFTLGCGAEKTDTKKDEKPAATDTDTKPADDDHSTDPVKPADEATPDDLVPPVNDGEVKEGTPELDKDLGIEDPLK